MRIFLIILGALACAASVVVYFNLQNDLAHPPLPVTGTITAINGGSDEVAAIEYKEAQGAVKQVYLVLPDTARFQVDETVKVYVEPDSLYVSLVAPPPSYGWLVYFLAGSGGIFILTGILFLLGSVTVLTAVFCGLAVVVTLGIGVVVVGNDARLQLTGKTVMGHVTEDYMATVASTDLRSNQPTGQRKMQQRQLVVEYSASDGSTRDLLLRAPLTNATVGAQVPLVVDFSAKPPQAVLKGWINVIFGTLIVLIFLVVFVGAGVLIFWMAKKFQW